MVCDSVIAFWFTSEQQAISPLHVRFSSYLSHHFGKPPTGNSPTKPAALSANKPSHRHVGAIASDAIELTMTLRVPHPIARPARQILRVAFTRIPRRKTSKSGLTPDSTLQNPPFRDRGCVSSLKGASAPQQGMSSKNCLDMLNPRPKNALENVGVVASCPIAPSFSLFRPAHMPIKPAPTCAAYRACISTSSSLLLANSHARHILLRNRDSSPC